MRAAVPTSIAILLLISPSHYALSVRRRGPARGLCLGAHRSSSAIGHHRIWSVIEALETNGLSSDSGADACKAHEDTTKQVIPILQRWGETWAGQPGWRTLLNKKSLLHEVEESIVALHFLSEWLESRTTDAGPVTLVDVCCGKGIMSLLASYLFSGKAATHVSRIIMLDKQQDINWNHIIAANGSAEEDDRPIIETWGGCNLHEVDHIVEKLESVSAENGQLALVGIHLCKLLSPSCAGVANALGPEKCPFLCLAPCCLPRVVRNLSKSSGKTAEKRKERPALVPVRMYETAEERQARIDANSRRDAAKTRTFADVPCYLCSEIHSIHKCNLLPPDATERIDIFQKAAAMQPCWKCGEIGHQRKDCPSPQEASKPRLALPPTFELDVASVIQNADNQREGPFESYCHLLGTAVERESVEIIDVGLVNNAAHHDNAANRDNWNRDRKSIFIVAAA